MQRPCGVMVWVAENIQACLRIFRRAQHQWLVRDILHQAQGVFDVFVLWHTGQLLHIALRCLEGSTPEDRSRADTQAAPVGRRMCGISIPRVSLRSALG